MGEPAGGYHAQVELSDWMEAPERPALHRLVQTLQPGAGVTLCLYTGGQVRGTVADTETPRPLPVPEESYDLPVTTPDRTYVVVSDTDTRRHVPRVWWRTADHTTRGTFLTGVRVRSPAPAENQLTADRTAADVFPQLDADGR